MAEIKFAGMAENVIGEGQHIEVPIFDVDGKQIQMNVSATCCSKNREIGLFLWGEAKQPESGEIYPLASWQSKGENLDFDFTTPLIEWRDSFKLSKVFFAQLEDISEKTPHPLEAICKEDVSGLKTEIKNFHLFSGLAHFSRLSRAGFIKGEVYGPYAKLLERLRRIDDVPPAAEVEAFLAAMESIGKERTMGKPYGEAPARW